MASSWSPAVKVLESCQVAAASHDELPALGEVSLPLTFFDLFWVGGQPVERLFFYHWPVATADFVASALPRLKRSLSATLRYYYPLAGRLRFAPGSDKLEFRCTDADSVPFTLAEYDGDLLHLAGDHPRGLETLRPLVPEIPAVDTHGSGPWALMALQVTVFPGAGVCVGVSLRHIACDGSSSTRFIKSWASACRTSEVAAPPTGRELPLIDRTLVSDPNGLLYTAIWNAMKSFIGGRWLSFPQVDGRNLVRSTFLLRLAHIEKLRRRASQTRPPPPPSFRYSSFVLTCAYVWVCLLNAGEQPPQDGDTAYFFFAVDCRGRLRPPLPAAYFGNCIGPCFVEARRSALTAEGGVGCGAEAIALSIKRLGEGGGVMEGAEAWIAKAAGWAPRRPPSLAGSPKFGVYDVDFGWGRPAKVEVMGIERTGAISLAESGEEEGGIEIGLALSAPATAKFGSLFAAGLEDADDEATR